jgi:diaminopropionate ammonia-lyase
MRFVNEAYRPGDVPPPATDAPAFHRTLPGYEPTPVRVLPDVAAAVGVAAVLVKDESARLGLPAFKILGASWAVERALRERPDAHTLVAASAGNHGRAVAHVAAARGLACRVFLPARALPVRRAAIEREGADVVVVDGAYEDAVAAAEAGAREPGVLLVADVGGAGPPTWVIDGYATLFVEARAQAGYDVVLVPVGVGSLAAAAARHAAAAGACAIGVEPETAACLTLSLAAGRPVEVETPGTVMAGLDCAAVSAAAWPTLRAGIRGTVTVGDDEARAALAELERHGLAIGESGAAPLAALHRLAADPELAALRRVAGLGPSTRVLLVAGEGRTGAPAGTTGRGAGRTEGSGRLA